MPEPLTLMAIHAHPDDEAMGTGGVLARYADEGVRTVLVTCTGGEAGEIADPGLATPENLAEVRDRELRDACEILRVRDLVLLGYRDSGMAGTPDNERPESFWQADLEAATRRLIGLVRHFRPQVMVTYDERGIYGHPDHIKAHQITLAAFEAAGVPGRYPQEGPPWAPLKLYYVAIPQARVAELGRRMAELGIESPFEQDTPEQDSPHVFGTPDELVTTVVDVSAYIDLKRRAILAHRTQMGDNVFFHKLPEPFFREAFGDEAYVRAACRVPAPDFETDLFAGLREKNHA